MCMHIGPLKALHISPMSINGAPMQWVKNIKYLGLSLVSGKKFSVDFKDVRRKFFIAVNSILSKCKFTSDIVKLELMESQCLPILLYCIESLNLSNVQVKAVNSWWNAVIRKIFDYNKWESVKNVICLLGRLDLIHIVNLRRLRFIKTLLTCDNQAMKELSIYYLRSPELVCLELQHGVKLRWTAAKITAMVYVHFKSLCLL